MDSQSTNWDGVPDALRGFAEAYHKYTDAVQAAAEADGARFAELYQRYMQAASETWNREDVQRPVSDAYMELTRMSSEVFSSSQARQRAAEAFRQYVGFVRDAWMTVDSDSLDPAAVATIGQSISNAAWIDYCVRSMADKDG